MIGTSGPSNSTTALSISAPANAASRCSTVPIVIPSPFDNTVHSGAAIVFTQLAWISAPASVRQNTIPVSGGAGRKVILTFRPEWRPTPRHPIGVFSVCCDAVVISPNMRQTSRKLSPTKFDPNGAPASYQITLCFKLLPDNLRLFCRPPKIDGNARGVGRRTGANSPDAAERPECRADRLPCSNPAGHPAPAAPAAAERRPWRAGQRDAASAPVGSSARGRPRSPVRSGWARAPWALAPAPWQPRRVERPAASAERCEQARHRPALVR